MNFSIEQKDRAAIFRPTESRLDSLIAPDLKAEFLIISQPDVELLVVDLSAVQYIDSAGLSALLLARRQQAAHDGEVRLAGVSKEVRSLLELTQLNRVFEIFETVQEALDAPQLSAVVIDPDGMPKKTSSRESLMRMSAAAGVASLAGAVFDGADDLEMFADDDLDEDEDMDDDDDDDFDDDDEDEEDEKDSSPDTPEKEAEVIPDEDFEFDDDIDFDEDEDDDDDDDL